MKKHNKLISFIFAIAVLFSFLVPTNLIATNVSSNSFNESYVSALDIKETITGLAPFDENNNAGNDINPDNNIVRSFDDINYTLEYVTELKTINPITEAYLMVEFILPCSKDIASFNMDAMAWMESPVLTEKNGQQILTGKRFLQNTSNSNAIPGEGTLSVGINVKAATNGTKIQPIFKLWMEGNNASEAKQITSQAIIVSAAPKYNIAIKKASYLDHLGWFNTTTGKEGTETDGQSSHGRMQGYAIMFQLYNDSLDKGLKGIELPSGDVSFDLTLTESKNTISDSTLVNNPEYTPLLWDYKPNISSNTGNLGRNMYWRFNSTTPVATATAPYNNGGGQAGCYNGGNWSVTQTGNNTYRVTIKNYAIDTVNFKFPTHNCNQSITADSQSYFANVGVVSSGYFEILCKFPRNVSDTTNIYLTTVIDNISMQSISGTKTNKDVVESDNNLGASITLYPPGNITKELSPYNATASTQISSIHYAGDASVFLGDNFYVNTVLSRSTDYTIKAFNYLFKFNTDGIEAREGEVKISAYVGNSIFGDSKILYAAKPDKTAWSSQTEMCQTKEDSLVYFTSLSDLKNKGYICVGVLVENRNATWYPGSWNHFANVFIPLKIKDNAKVNTTYDVVSDFCIWETNISYTKEGNPSTTRPTPDAYINTNSYTKTEYDKYGEQIPGTHASGYVYGQTVLVIGYKSMITKQIETLSSSGTEKKTFDMDANERTVEFGLIAKTYTDKTTNSQGTTTLYIYDTLPKDLYYNAGSSYYKGQSFEPTITKNADGTTELKWTLTNVKINETLPKITFSCTIGKAGTNDDVYNNQIITNKVLINGDGDRRIPNSSNGNYSESSITIIKLNAIAISKSTSTPFVNIGQDFTYSLKYANNAQNIITNSKLYDILPYNGDNRGSDFSGTYNIKSIVIDFSNAPKTFALYQTGNDYLKYTNKTDIRNLNYNNLKNYNSWSNITNKSIDNTNMKITYSDIPTNIIALLFNIDLEGFESVEITMTCTPIALNGKTQEEGNVYVNDFHQFANGQIDFVHSNKAAVQIYGKLKITKQWVDNQNQYNSRPANLTITLYQGNHIFRTITLNNSNVSNDLNSWTAIAHNVPLYDSTGKPYVYTIKEDEQNINLLKYYYPVKPEYYNQKTLTVTNYLIGIPMNQNGFPEYKITVTKDIVNKNNQSPTIKDFEIMKLDPQATYQFPIVLREMERILSTGPNSMVETYGTYTGNILNGILTNKGQLIFSNINPGKYEISEKAIQYFNFVDIKEIGEPDIINNDGVLFVKENEKYYIIISGITQNNEEITVKVTNKLEDFRPYKDKNIKDNLFKYN